MHCFTWRRNWWNECRARVTKRLPKVIYPKLPKTLLKVNQSVFGVLDHVIDIMFSKNSAPYKLTLTVAIAHIPISKMGSYVQCSEATEYSQRYRRLDDFDAEILSKCLWCTRRVKRNFLTTDVIVKGSFSISSLLRSADVGGHISWESVSFHRQPCVR